MVFSGINNQVVELEIINYQYPHITTPTDYDSNWLNIQINAKTNYGHWNTVDPALLTWEVETLIKWLHNVADDKEVTLDLEFIEPNLSFYLTEKNEDFKRVKIQFDLESRPPFAKNEVVYYVEGSFKNEELRHMSAQLTTELLKFPVR